MGQIATTDARNVFTKMLIDVYKEQPDVKTFLRSFFETKESDTKEVSIEIQRGTEYAAVDVLRGTEGNRNTFSRSSEKIIVPPYYREYFDATDLDFYDQLFGGARSQVDGRTFGGWLSQVAEKMVLLREKIERAYEVQCAQVLEDGIVQLNNGDNIDYTRKAAHLVDVGGAAYWSETLADPLADLEAGCVLLRTNGKMQSGTVNALMGSGALNAFLAHDSVKDRANLRRVALIDMKTPQTNSSGGVFHGQVSAGSWTINLWTYPEFYDIVDGAANVPFISDNKITLVPEKPRFKMAFGAVPMILRDTGNAEIPAYISQTRAAYVLGNRLDDRGDKHIFDIKSAGIAVPVAVDQIYTAQVLA